MNSLDKLLINKELNEKIELLKKNSITLKRIKSKKENSIIVIFINF